MPFPIQPLGGSRSHPEPQPQKKDQDGRSPQALMGQSSPNTCLTRGLKGWKQSDTGTSYRVPLCLQAPAARSHHFRRPHCQAQLSSGSTPTLKSQAKQVLSPTPSDLQQKSASSLPGLKSRDANKPTCPLLIRRERHSECVGSITSLELPMDPSRVQSPVYSPPPEKEIPCHF